MRMQKKIPVAIPWMGSQWTILWLSSLLLYKMVVVHSLHPTKWYVHKPWLYKMVVPFTCFDPQIF